MATSGDTDRWLFWHRADLRGRDNVGLARAASRGEVVPVFVLDPDVLEHAAPPRVAFMLEALDSLRAWYRDRDSDLLVVRGDPADLLPDLADAHGAAGVAFNEDYSGLARERDRRVTDALQAADLSVEEATDRLHHAPGTITTNQGEHYSVFSYFWKKWRDRPKEDPIDPPGAGRLAPVDGTPIPSAADLGFEAPEADVEPAGPQRARDRLEAFCDGPIFRYDEARDDPAAGGTSRLSAHLKWGTIGVRTVYAATVDAMEAARTAAEEDGVEEFRSQLAWREFYAHVLRYNPSVVTENFSSYDHEIEWREDREALQAWRDGETGYPIVDAGMRQLRAEAWMHNRVRMIVASFLTKDLLIDWRAGYDWFRQRLADHDTANDNGGWQWAASTGTDAQPYFRVFNPMTQGERHDPDAEYIKRYVPELRGVDPETIHGWHECSTAQRREAAPDYPDPIVDHGARREAAIEMFEAARGDD